MPDQSLETQPHGFCIGRRATGFLRVAKGDLINAERFLHTSKITISIQRYQPYPIRRPPLSEEQLASAFPPKSKQLVALRLDRDVLAWLKQYGSGYSTRINVILRAAMTARRSV